MSIQIQFISPGLCRIAGQRYKVSCRAKPEVIQKKWGKVTALLQRRLEIAAQHHTDALTETAREKRAFKIEKQGLSTFSPLKSCFETIYAPSTREAQNQWLHPTLLPTPSVPPSSKEDISPKKESLPSSPAAVTDTDPEVLAREMGTQIVRELSGPLLASEPSTEQEEKERAQEAFELIMGNPLLFDLVHDPAFAAVTRSGAAKELQIILSAYLTQVRQALLAQKTQETPLAKKKTIDRLAHALSLAKKQLLSKVKQAEREAPQLLKKIRKESFSPKPPRPSGFLAALRWRFQSPPLRPQTEVGVAADSLFEALQRAYQDPIPQETAPISGLFSPTPLSSNYQDLASLLFYHALYGNMQVWSTDEYSSGERGVFEEAATAALETKIADAMRRLGRESSSGGEADSSSSEE